MDGPSHKVYTPLGPLLAVGYDPGAEMLAYASTTGGRIWASVPQPLITEVPPGSTPEQLSEGLRILRDAAEQPPVEDQLIWLAQERPYLPDP